nr:immunoglobulin light chain junction region [Macaca mulatta]
CQHYYGTPCSF